MTKKISKFLIYLCFITLILTGCTDTSETTDSECEEQRQAAENLAPCRFCGCNYVTLRFYDHNRWYVTCEKCGARTGISLDWQEVVNEWENAMGGEEDE